MQVIIEDFERTQEINKLLYVLCKKCEAQKNLNINIRGELNVLYKHCLIFEVNESLKHKTTIKGIK